MARTWRILSLVMAFSLTPGAAEAIENLAHLVHDGHMAHATAHDDDHAPEGDEHGCNSVFHACACHVSVSFLVHRTGGLEIAAPLGPTVRPMETERTLASDGVAPGVFRPPIG